jgi:hypothetical protein
MPDKGFSKEAAINIAPLFSGIKSNVNIDLHSNEPICIRSILKPIPEVVSPLDRFFTSA